jgi:signal transduction histidine kinase
LRERHYFLRRNLTPAQIGLLVTVAVLILAVEVVIFVAYFVVAEAANTYEQASFGLPNLGNVQREALLLEIKSDDYLEQPGQETRPVEIQRGLLANHIQIAKAQFSHDPDTVVRLEEVEETLATYDAWWAAIPANPSAEVRSAAQEQLDSIGQQLDRQIKALYDLQEQTFFGRISEAIQTQQLVQTLLIGTNVAVLLLGAASVLSLRRSISQEFEQAYHQLEAEVAVRKQSEISLAQARDQAVAASRFKSQLLAKVSHELRTPLGAIMGYTELLQNGVFGPLSQQQQGVTAEVIDSTDYLAKLVNELLDQAQNESGAMRLHIRPVAPADILQYVEAQLGVLAQNKGLLLATEMDEDVPLLLMGDYERLQQIVVNLVGNAIKFTDSGRVRVRLFRPDPAHWAIEVADTGAGIPQEAQIYIFEPFRQVNDSMTRQQGGTGLGLAIVQQLAGLMGGQITLESKIGVGSTFTVVLPLELTAEKIG